MTPRGDSDDGPAAVRFEQVRSVGILLTLGVLLGLVIYNAVSAGTPWQSRANDVRLLMILLSVLLGIDVLVEGREALVELFGRVLRLLGDALLRHLDLNHPRHDDHDHPPPRQRRPPTADESVHPRDRTPDRHRDRGDSDRDDADESE